jgi:exodeoxyribonuclease VII small subunit
MPDAATESTFPDIAEMRYEEAREELVSIVSRLETGQAPLEDSMQLWRRGEALAAHCSQWLDDAQTEIERAIRPDAAGQSPTSTPTPNED